MKTFPYFHKLFCSPIMILESVRTGMEIDLLSRVGITPQMRAGGMSADAQRPLPDREYGKQGRADEEWLSALRTAEAVRAAWRVEQLYKVYDSVAVVHVAGVIDKHLSDFDLSCYGGCDLADVDRALSLAANDDRVERVVLAVNSPGGSVTGVPETATRISALRQNKEVHSFVDGMATSAAQWIAAQADVTVVAPSARMGSVGVYLAALDATRAYEMEGYKVELIRAGKWKAMGSPFKPLTDEERAMFQAGVDELHADFRHAVREGRGRDIPDEDMEGQVHGGKDAVAKGFADVLTTANLDEYVAALL